jgi:hypothetical protein
MAWDGWPVESNITDVQKYDWIRQLWEAVRERGWCTAGTVTENTTGSPTRQEVSNAIFPGGNIVWGGGFITSLVDNEDGTWTLTDANNAAAGGPDNGHWWNGGTRDEDDCGVSPAKYWVGVDCNDATHLPTSYDVMIQPDTPAGGFSGVDSEWYRDQQPWTVIRGNIVDNTSKTLKFECRLDNYVTAGVIPPNPATNLIGARFYIIKTGGVFWADSKDSWYFGRYIDYPNDNEHFRGTATEGGKIYTDGTGYLHCATANEKWDTPITTPPTDPVFKGKEVLFYDTTGTLHRLEATGNSDGKDGLIFFGDLEAIPTEEEEEEVEFTVKGWPFCVIDPDGRAWPGRVPWPIGWFNGSAKDSVISHDPSDTLVARQGVLTSSITWEEVIFGDTETSCGDPESIKTEFDAVDKDVRTSEYNTCPGNGADKLFAPQLPKSLRWIQNTIVGMVSSFVRPIEYTSNSEYPIPGYSPAQCFHDCGINSGTASIDTSEQTVGGVTTSYHSFTVGADYVGHGVYWEAKRANGWRLATGFTASDEFGVIQLATNAPTYEGGSVVYSAGWSRFHPLEVTRFYPQTVFIPDIDYEPEIPQPIFLPGVVDFCGDEQDPPPEECANDCFGVGAWHSSGVSQGYKTFDRYGYAIEGAHPDKTVGDMVRWTGVNWHEPGTGPDSYGTEEDAPEVKFWDRTYEGHLSHVNQARINQQFRGRCQAEDNHTAVGKHFIRDNQQNWFKYWYNDVEAPNGVMKVHTGEATGGSSTTLVTEEALTDPEDELGCWFKPSRFPGPVFDGKPFLGFTLEVDKTEEVPDPEDPEETIETTVTYHFLITNVTTFAEGQAPTLHFTAQLKANPTKEDEEVEIEEGDVWRIKEPATNLNRFLTRRVKILEPDGTTVEVPIIGNDATTLFFEPRENPIQAGSSFEVIDYTGNRGGIGGVWKWQTTAPTTEEKANRRWHKVQYTYQGPPTDPEDPETAPEPEEITGYWVQPVGSDPRGQPWERQMTHNLPHLAPKAYGPIIKGDYINIVTFDEMFRVLNKLIWTQGGHSWTANGEMNLKVADSEGGWGVGNPGDSDGLDSYRKNLVDIENVVKKQWDDITYTSSYPTDRQYYDHEGTGASISDNPNQAPQAIGTISADISGLLIAVALSRHKYGTVTTPNLIACTVDFYAFAQMYSAYPEEVEECWGSIKFDDWGTGLQFRKWAKWNTVGPSKAATRITSEALGDNGDAQPELGDLRQDVGPTETLPECYGYGGWYAETSFNVTGWTTVRRWNVTGGLRYYDGGPGWSGLWAFMGTGA